MAVDSTQTLTTLSTSFSLGLYPAECNRKPAVIGNNEDILRICIKRGFHCPVSHDKTTSRLVLKIHFFNQINQILSKRNGLHNIYI